VEIHDSLATRGTDDSVLIRVLSSHKNAEIQEIRAAYEAKYGKSLVDDLEGDTSGSYENMVVFMVTERRVCEAGLIRDAIKGAGTDEQMLIDVIMARNAFELKAIAAAYKREYQSDMVTDILEELTSKLKPIFTAALAMDREAGDAKPTRINGDVQKFRTATEGKVDKEAVFEILFQNSMLHNREVFATFERTYNESVLEILEDKFKGDEEDSVLAVAQWCMDPAMLTASIIKRCFKGIGTDEKSLDALLATRYDICKFGHVAAAYDHKYGKGQLRKFRGI
ncbi:annexin, partial [Kipferlia bialata]